MTNYPDQEGDVKRHALFFMITVLSYTSAIAQMPIPLLEEDRTVDYEQWQKIMPLMQAGLECQNYINPEFPPLNTVFTSNPIGQWEFIPPKGFTVFEFPIQSITIYIDPDGEMGASYTSSVAARKTDVEEKINSQYTTKVGMLMVEQGVQSSLTDITCTIAGSREMEE